MTANGDMIQKMMMTPGGSIRSDLPAPRKATCDTPSIGDATETPYRCITSQSLTESNNILHATETVYSQKMKQ
ncbi:hypothetical protein Tcan_03429 [Toxocara canis]|uniref:Uncharacterized protein n=1 Tax=Toxocara canis TaxID=6265 RepID=A0A0B2VNJ0_TOXCA|nr:hypothetical protein Tcan_03429 [Toxocara canis]